ncbi:hypothetical protein F5B22DRAFT_658457 [Xylaria bambusicola]|uniref:uncharacterized protein n=1 Tax=Xylaria bambusicola TaxID=326684 RepID=UPI0020081CCC|nr:uncharacterized protein F5B22DRAFT_658457 [Xylaria bambusicola]KAI0525650.1 hypothetical protein F5B22DRAFT_658457 [Xylaria bambusicola]
MGAKSGLALKALQWFVRGIQFGSCAVALALFSYFLAVAAQHNYRIPTWSKAVEGIAGVGVLYTLLGLLLLCCVAGHPFASAIAIILDIAFIGAFIYVAQANRGGASSCRGTVSTVFGRRPASDHLGSGLPSYHTICQMHSAVLAVSIIAIVFFLISAFLEVVLVRHRRKESRFGPSPANNYTSGYGGRGGFFSRFRRRKGSSEEEAINPNQLPEHTHPDQVRPSYNTESTAGGAHYNKYGESGFQHDGQTAYPNRTSYPAGGQQYGDGTYGR